MNLNLNQLNLSSAAVSTAAPNNSVSSAVNAAASAAAPLQQAGTAAEQPARAFAAWLGLSPAADGAAAADAAAADAAAVATALTAESALSAEDSLSLEAGAADEQQANADAPLLSAMSVNMPLMPVIQTTLAALAAALPGVPAEAGDDSTTDAEATSSGAPERINTTSGSRDAGLAQALPAAALAMPASSSADSAARAAQPVSTSTASARPASADDTQSDAVLASSDRIPASGFSVAAAATTATPRSADTLTLAGPPSAWRQSLQEALGDRLQLQVGKNAEQASIRLDPPQLGRVDITIRHSAGTLEVQISATHGEVLRQLREVGESLRGDLAQRQFSDVSVNIVPAARAGTAASLFAGDGSGRGRQQDDSASEQTPGQALAEANTGAHPFSLNGRS